MDLTLHSPPGLNAALDRKQLATIVNACRRSIIVVVGIARTKG